MRQMSLRSSVIFFISSSKLSKKTYDGLGCYLSAKGKCQNKKSLVFTCAAFDVTIIDLMEGYKAR